MSAAVEQKPIDMIKSVLGALANDFVISPKMENLAAQYQQANVTLTKEFLFKQMLKEGNKKNVAFINAIEEAGTEERAKVTKVVAEKSQGVYGSPAQQAKQEIELAKKFDVDTDHPKISTAQQTANRENMAVVAKEEAPKKVEQAEEVIVPAKLEQRTAEESVVAYKAAKEVGMLPAPFVHNKAEIVKDERGFATNLKLATDFAQNRGEMGVSRLVAMQPRKPASTFTLGVAA